MQAMVGLHRIFKRPFRLRAALWRRQMQPLLAPSCKARKKQRAAGSRLLQQMRGVLQSAPVPLLLFLSAEAGRMQVLAERLHLAGSSQRLKLRAKTKNSLIPHLTRILKSSGINW